MTLYAGETLERFQPHFELLFGSNGDLIGIQNPRANGADLRFSSDGTETIGTLNVTTAFNLYNTSPISATDYERLRLDWSSNVARVWTQNNGTGSTRALRVGSATADGATEPNQYTTWNSSATPVIQHSIGGGGATGVWHELANTLAALSASSGTQTAVAVSPTFAQTSTATGIALLVNPSGTFGSGGGKLQSWQLASSEVAQINTIGVLNNTAVVVAGGGYFGLQGGAVGASADVSLFRDAADTLAQRRSTNAQTFRVYNTYTDASNNERGFLAWGGSELLVGTAASGTGTSRSLVLTTNNTGRWLVGATSGHLLAYTDNTYDIGAPGATRPRNLYVGGGITHGSATLLTTTTALTNGADAAAGTLTNAPAVGNPTKWIPINDNGTTRYIPAW